MAHGPHRAGRPRPVAGVPPPELADGAAAAHAWLLTLVAATPLEAMGGLPVAAAAADGPALCAAALAAVGSDAELARLHPGGDLAATAAGAGRLAGAADPAATAAAVAALREALWSVLESGLPPTDGRHVAAVAMRLSHVCDVLTGAALAAPAAEPPAAASPAAPRPAATGDLTWAGGDALVVSRGGAERAATATVARRIAGRGDGFAVLALEVDDARRLLAADGGGEAADALAAAERAVRQAAEAAGAEVTSGRERQWVVTDAARDLAAARALGERLAAAAATVALDGAPLEVSIGVAVWPHDGTTAEELLARADEGVFAARAAGVRVA